MLLEYDPVTSLRHWPTPMRRFGTNLYGDALYRIVFTESRRHLVGGCWPDGHMGYHWVPKYRAIQSPWILERWYTPEQYCKMSRRKWETERVDPISGWPLQPYPDRGEYDLVWEFDQGPTVDNLEAIVGAIEQARARSFQDVRDAHMADYAYEEKETRANGYLELRDDMTAFGSAPIASRLVGRGTKTRPDLLSANELGLPMPRPGKGLGQLQMSSTLLAAQSKEERQRWHK